MNIQDYSKAKNGILIEIEKLQKLLRCNCEKTEIKIKEYSNGAKHYVYQCLNCGFQSGNPISKNNALSIADGKLITEFNTEITVDFQAKRKQICKKIEELKFEYKRINSLSKEIQIPESSSSSQDYSLYETDLIKQINLSIHHLGQERCISILREKIRNIYSEEYQAQKNQLNLFTSESEIETWIDQYFSEDFIVYSQVKGKHQYKDKHVIIDYLFFPRNHLVKEGFIEDYFGIEVKYFNIEEDFVHKTSRGFWQSISYNDCFFNINSKIIKPRFNLLLSNFSFEDEMHLLRLFSMADFANKYERWYGMLHLANHAGVGQMLILGNKDDPDGWLIKFGQGGGYFSASKQRKSQAIEYKLGNENLIDKIRIGNF